MKSARSPRSTQVKLLRVISEERAFERVGGNQTLHADVRLIAATNKNLEATGAAKENSATIFSFRLNVVRITMPPLRDRKEDIPLLVRGFLAALLPKRTNKPVVDLTARRDECAADLRLAGQRARAADRDRARRGHGHRPEDHGARSADARSARPPAQPCRAGFRRRKPLAKKPARSICTRQSAKLIMQALAATNGNVTAAAKKLGISRRTLHRKINEMNAENSNEEAARPQPLRNDGSLQQHAG